MQNSNFAPGARMAVLLCTEATQNIYRGEAEVDFLGCAEVQNKITATQARGTKLAFFPERLIIPSFWFLRSPFLAYP